MGLTQIAVRALVAYLYLLVVTRVGGKRVVGQATPFDFIIALIIGDLVDDALWAEVSMARFGAAVGAIIALDLILKVAACHSNAFYLLIEGRPSVLLRDGKEEPDELRREQLSESDLAHLLRLDGIDKKHEVQWGVLDHGSELAVIKKWLNRPVQKIEKELVK